MRLESWVARLNDTYALEAAYKLILETFDVRLSTWQFGKLTRGNRSKSSNSDG